MKKLFFSFKLASLENINKVKLASGASQESFEFFFNYKIFGEIRTLDLPISGGGGTNPLVLPSHFWKGGGGHKPPCPPSPTPSEVQ